MICPECDGVGNIIYVDNDGEDQTEVCNECGGSGQLTNEGERLAQEGE